MKKTYLFLFGLICSFLLVNTQDVMAEDVESLPTIVYFYTPACPDCGSVAPYIDDLENEGINVIKIDTTYRDQLIERLNYQVTYGALKEKHNSGPIVFAGDKFYSGVNSIISNIDKGNIQREAYEPLLEVDPDAYEDYKESEKYLGILGFFTLIGVGLLDGVNPCAMAMLLLFISLLLGVSKRKRTLIGVSISYILGLFLTYFALGAFLMNYLHYINIEPIQIFIDIFILSLAILLFSLNLYDFIVSKNEEFGKVKNQLPKPIQKLNKKIIKFFTKSLDDKNIFMVYFLTFSLGVIISMTEFLCTGQMYLPSILILDKIYDSIILKFYGLLVYNLAFIIPLIVLAVLVIKSSSIMTTSDKIRQRLSLIKLLNALVFLGIIIYFIYKIFFKG